LHYFASFFLPLNLSADTDWEPITNAADTRVLVGLAFIALMLVVAIRAWRKNETRPISLGIWWFIVGVSPTSSGVVVLSEVMNDHRMFLPFIGLAIAATWGILRLVETKWQPTFAALIAILLSSHSYGTFQRNKVWKDEESLWYDVTIKSPRNGRGLMNYGLSLMARGQIKEALYYFDRARQFAPNYAYLHINTAIALDQLGDLPKAEEYFNKAISTNPNYAGCYYYYSRFLDKHERFDEAILLLDKSLKVAPTFAESRYLLMRIHAKRKDWQGLRTVAEDTLKVWPHDDQASSFRQIALTAANDQKPDSF
jgi:protein O-mannosyl-transferase